MAGRIWLRRAATAWSDTESVPWPASGTSTTSARPSAPLPTAVAVTGSRIGPPAAARPCSAATAAITRGPVASGPVTTTSAGAGACGNARWISLMVRTTAWPGGASTAGSPSRMPSAGAASASRATAAAVPQIAGWATTRRTSAAHSRDGRAAARLRPRNGIRPRSARGPSQDSSAGSTVSEPATAMPTTAIVPSAMPVNWSMPVRNSPAIAIITVPPDTRIARPDVPAAIRSDSGSARPFARSSRSRSWQVGDRAEPQRRQHRPGRTSCRAAWRMLASPANVLPGARAWISTTSAAEP